jgi:hypothetical protein
MKNDTLSRCSFYLCAIFRTDVYFLSTCNMPRICYTLYIYCLVDRRMNYRLVNARWSPAYAIPPISKIALLKYYVLRDLSPQKTTESYI